MAMKPASAELRSGPGFRIRPAFQRPPQACIDEYWNFETPDISDMLNRLYSMTPDIRNLVNDAPLCGPALTVKVYPGDNLMVHKALDLAQPGDVIVVDAGGHRSNAVFGDMVARKAKHRGIAGYIVDGLVRDLPGLQALGMPVYAKGVTPIGPLHRGPGEINFPISCGGIVVNAGDIVCADRSGIVVVRAHFAESVLKRLSDQSDSLAVYNASIDRGDFSNMWVDNVLEEAGCAYEN